MLSIAWVRVLRVVRISLSSADGEGTIGKGVFLLRAIEARTSGCARKFWR